MSTNTDPDADALTIRATVGDVRQNMHIEDWDSIGIPDSQIEYYIEQRAAPFVDEELASGDNEGEIAEWRLTQIEALLAAHWMATSNDTSLRQARREGTADGAYAWLAGTPEDAQGFYSTTMGQAAIDLDPTGTLEGVSDSGDSTQEFTFRAF